IRSTSSRRIIAASRGQEPPQDLLDPGREPHGELEVGSRAVHLEHHPAPELLVEHFPPERRARPAGRGGGGCSVRGGRERADPPPCGTATATTGNSRPFALWAVSSRTRSAPGSRRSTSETRAASARKSASVPAGAGPAPTGCPSTAGPGSGAASRAGAPPVC